MTTTVERTVDRIVDLMERGVTAGASMLDSLAGSPIVSRAQMRMPRLGACSCDIPPPCWMPREHGPIRTHVCAGGTATLRVRLTNCSIEPSKIEIQASGPDGGKIDMDPKSLSLGPLERGVVALSLKTEVDEASGTEHEALVWIRGCVDHVIRWTVNVSRRGGDSCHELDIDDCPDYVHHWYDHFYCARPCRHHQRQGVTHGSRG
jgi:hypothetical protein